MNIWKMGPATKVGREKTVHRFCVNQKNVTSFLCRTSVDWRVERAKKVRKYHFVSLSHTLKAMREFL